MSESTQSPPATMERVVGVFGATMMGLGSIVGTGVFVSLAVGAGVAGPAVIIAVVIGAAVALCNGMSSGQLAANYPVAGGTYEYGYRCLNPAMGFTAGWMFLCAKSASAATAALGLAGYLFNTIGVDERWITPAAVAAVILFGALVLTGLKRSNHANTVIVSITLATLAAFVFAGLAYVFNSTGSQTGTPVAEKVADHLTPFFNPTPGHDDRSPVAGLLEASALMFVAYTGYGRIATLGEEIRNPKRNIPIAIFVTLAVSMIFYLAVTVVAIAAVGAPAFADAASSSAAPLETVARAVAGPWLAWVLVVGAITAMAGVLLNLILGLSRVALAMGRRHDMPSPIGNLTPAGTPAVAIVLVTLIIAGLALFGDVRTTWSFSAATVLVYYALTNLAALKLKPEQRLYPPLVSVLGLVACLFLVLWVDPKVLAFAAGLIVVGLLWHAVARRLSQSRQDPQP